MSDFLQCYYILNHYMRTLGALVFQETVLQCCYNLKPMHRTECSRLLLCSRILFCTAAAAIIAVLVSKPLQENSRRVLCFPGDGFVLGLTGARSKFGEVSMSKELFLCMYKKKARGPEAYTVMVETNGIFWNNKKVSKSSFSSHNHGEILFLYVSKVNWTGGSNHHL